MDTRKDDTSKLVLVVKADYNDADYVSSETEVAEKDLEGIRSIVAAVKANGGNWPAGDRAALTEMYGESHRTFCRFVPHAPDAMRVHTIEHISLKKIEYEIRLL